MERSINRLINTLLMHQELLVFIGKLYLRITICPLQPRGKFIRPVYYLSYFTEESVGHL